MDTFFWDFLRTLSGQGPLGMATVVMLLGMGFVMSMAYWVQRDREKQLSAEIESHKQDKQQLIEIVKNNTEAMTRTTAAVENCTGAIQQNTYLLQRLLARWGL